MKVGFVGAVKKSMNDDMEMSRRTWAAAVKLAIVLSLIAAVVAIIVSSIGNVPTIAVVAPVMIVAFCASWVQTGRVLRGPVRPAVLVVGR